MRGEGGREGESSGSLCSGEGADSRAPLLEDAQGWAGAMASPTPREASPSRAPGGSKQLFQNKVKLLSAFKGSVLPSWEDTEIDTLPAHIVRPAAVKLGMLDMEIKTMDIASLSSGLAKLTTGTMAELTMGASDKLLDEVGAGDLSESFKHRWVVLWRHPDLTRGSYQLIWYESEKALQPSGSVELTRGDVTVANPKKHRKGHSYAFELTVKDEEDDDDFRVTFSAATFADKVAWMNILEDYNGEREFVDSEDTKLHADLPKIHHLQYDQLPAAVLKATALKCGYMHKQGKGGTQQFKKRWFVLWHHPMSLADGWALLWYETEDSVDPKGHELLKVCSYNVAVEEDSKQNKKKKKYGDRFKLEVDDEEGRRIKYVLATDNSFELNEWVEMLMSQEDKNGQRASSMAAGAGFGGDEEAVSYSKLLHQVPRVGLENYVIPVRTALTSTSIGLRTPLRLHSGVVVVSCVQPQVCTEEERKELSEALCAKLADAVKDKAEAKHGSAVDERRVQKAEQQTARLKAQLQQYAELDSLSDTEKAAAQATAAAYAVLSNAAVDASRESAYVAALACLLSGKMSDLENVPTPPGPMTKDKCEMLRKGERPILISAPIVAHNSGRPVPRTDCLRCRTRRNCLQQF